MGPEKGRHCEPPFFQPLARQKRSLGSLAFSPTGKSSVEFGSDFVEWGFRSAPKRG
jgi:hypothetical protein